MAMDRTMYGKVQPGASYQPYRITIKRGREAEAPGCKFLWFLMSKLHFFFTL